MRRNLLSAIFSSNLVKDTLLLLNEDAMQIEDMLSALKTSRQALYPRLRILEDGNMISVVDGYCRLTSVGRIVVENMVPLLDTLDLLDDVGDYDMSFIPPHLLKRIREIGPCSVVEPSIPDLCDLDEEFQRKSLGSRSVIAITTFMFPNFSDIFTRYAERGVSVSVIITNELSDKLKNERPDEFRKVLDHGNTNVYVHEDDVRMVSFTQNDHGIMLRLLLTSDRISYDYRRIFLQGPGALRWGRELFEHYRNSSVLLTGI